MSRLNTFELCIIAVIMIPSIAFAIKRKDGFANKWHNKSVEIAKQIGCFGVMSRSIPLTIAAVIFAPSRILLSCKNAK